MLWVFSTEAFSLLFWHSAEADVGKTRKLYAQSPLSPLWKPVVHAALPQASFFPHLCSSCTDNWLLRTACYRHGQLGAVCSWIQCWIDSCSLSGNKSQWTDRTFFCIFLIDRGLEQPTAHMRYCVNIFFSSVPLQREVWAWEWVGLRCVAQRHNHHCRADKMVALKRLKKTALNTQPRCLYVLGKKKTIYIGR